MVLLSLDMAFKAKIVDLDGLRVVMVKDDRQSVTVQALVNAGSREENDENAGVAHFVEHYVFKGTKEYPKLLDLSGAIEGVGGMVNAYTSNTNIGFWAKTDISQLPLTIKAVGQMVTEPIFPEKYFEREKGTIIEELNLYEDDPSSKVSEEKWKLLFGKSTGLGRPTIGTVKSLKGMKVTDLKNFMDKWFTLRNVMVGVVGNWSNDDELLKLVKKEFKGLYDRDKQVPERDGFLWTKPEKTKIVFIKRKVDQAYISIGFPSLEIGHPLRWAMYLMNIILGGSQLSKLFREVREQRGWAYSVGSGSESFLDAGAFLVGGGIRKDKIKEAADLIMEIMWGLSGKGKWAITARDLKMAKECYKGRTSLSFDKPEKVLGYALYDLMFENRIYSPEEIKENADKVSLEDIREVCRQIFVPEKMSLAVLGNFEKMPVIF